VQLYTGLVHDGPGLVRRILRELPQCLDGQGFATLRDAIGVDA
jgi:dihydroorotate dehydrogenase